MDIVIAIHQFIVATDNYTETMYLRHLQNWILFVLTQFGRGGGGLLDTTATNYRFVWSYYQI